MPVTKLENLTEQQKAVVDAILFEGILRGYEEILSGLRHEYALSESEDPHYSYYVKHVIVLIEEKYNALVEELDATA